MRMRKAEPETLLKWHKPLIIFNKTFLKHILSSLLIQIFNLILQVRNDLYQDRRVNDAEGWRNDVDMGNIIKNDRQEEFKHIIVVHI